jgi:C-terminal processing protease CtpA/Prc
VVLISRSTFSAAENLIADLERRTKAVFVGEDSGGSPNLYGDVTTVELPSAGVSVNIATQYWQKSTADDPRVTIEPDVRVPLSSRSYFRGGDPVLAAALAYRVRR